jgi:hypothetical protein
MDVNEDFVDIAKGFIDNGVEFLIVGAYRQGPLHRQGGNGTQQACIRPTQRPRGRRATEERRIAGR